MTTLEDIDWHDYAEACLLHDKPHGQACCDELAQRYQQPPVIGVTWDCE